MTLDTAVCVEEMCVFGLPWCHTLRAFSVPNRAGGTLLWKINENTRESPLRQTTMAASTQSHFLFVNHSFGWGTVHAACQSFAVSGTHIRLKLQWVGCLMRSSCWKSVTVNNTDEISCQIVSRSWNRDIKVLTEAMKRNGDNHAIPAANLIITFSFSEKKIYWASSSSCCC